MLTIFLGLVAMNSLALTLTLGAAYLPAGWAWGGLTAPILHMLLGLGTTLMLLSTHGFVILNYFIATGKAVDAELKDTEHFAAYKKRTRKLKGRTFPFATMAAIFTIVAAVLGGPAARMGGYAPHAWWAWWLVMFNAFAFYMEFGSIKRNMALLAEVRAIRVQRRAEAQSKGEAA